MKNVPNLFNFDEFMDSLRDVAAHIEPSHRTGEVPEQEFHHNTCKYSRCTTCDKTWNCEQYQDLCDKAMDGYQGCMAECVDYEPVKFRKQGKVKDDRDQTPS